MHLTGQWNWGGKPHREPSCSQCTHDMRWQSRTWPEAALVPIGEQPPAAAARAAGAAPPRRHLRVHLLLVQHVLV